MTEMMQTGKTRQPIMWKQHMIRSITILLLITVFIPSFAIAEVAEAELQETPKEAWVGERVAFFVELRSPATFSGTATFNLPHIAGTTIISVGGPIVSSKEFEGEQWSVQRHEFALFCQRAGTLKVPGFAVRFTRKETFTGPEHDVTGTVPGWEIKIQQPPGSENVGYLLTTESFEVTEEWNPKPADAKVGDVFKRSITQRAANVSGMALVPVSKTVPDQVRFYLGDVQTNDKLERGDFHGERKETVQYLLMDDGQVSLPALTYVWWNPKSEKLQSKTLPAVTFNVQPAPMTKVTDSKQDGSVSWIWLCIVLSIIGGVLFAKWESIRTTVLTLWHKLNPEDHVVARTLIRACRANDVVAAESAWSSWRATQTSDFQPSEELCTAIVEMHRHVYAAECDETWNGEQLAITFKQQVKQRLPLSSSLNRKVLPPLNP